ncbi:MAG TPA: winged helix DNA-binding domain-containing protein [Pseudonocardia sp.]|uniref:winged helix DNA-binding domain-containing protein n=1 Tax=Pseudonocardia sp. TaxID=60912 RepID=UPI002B4B7D91|nr:winged helix DNA-binding domain-containing protein [Pseudonocardia sp.]HLU55845.1 winged helix DNA-binding domain-containing protein [Pseudonocardia sp.]
MRHIDVAERRNRLAVRQLLTPAARTDDVAAIADAVVGLHSTDPVTVHLSAAARMRTPVLPAADDALYVQRSLLRHHAMRRTLWVLGLELARAAHHSCTVTLVGRQRKMLLDAVAGAGLGPDPERWVDAATTEILEVLADKGPLAARELGRLVPHLAVPITIGTGRQATEVAAHSRLLLVLGFEGRVLRARPTGTWINGQYRWAAAQAWAPGFDEPLDPRTAAATLVRAWLRAFGPGTRADVQWWTGWTATTTARALADAGAVEVELAEGTGYVLPDDVDPVGPAEPFVALLPSLDPTTMGWKQRGFHLDPTHGPLLFDRNGNGGATIWVDGRIVGGWAQRADGTIALRVLEDIGRERTAEVERAAHELERLLGDVRFTPRFPAPLHKELRS